MAEKRRETLSFQDAETTPKAVFGHVGMGQLTPTSSFCALLFFGVITNPSLSMSSQALLATGENPGLVLSSASNLPVPINSMTAFPNEWDNDVGGVLTMLLEATVVEAIEDDDEEVDGDFMIREGIAVAVRPLVAKILWAVLPCRGTDADKSLENFGGLGPATEPVWVVEAIILDA